MSKSIRCFSANRIASYITYGSQPFQAIPNLTSKFWNAWWIPGDKTNLNILFILFLSRLWGAQELPTSLFEWLSLIITMDGESRISELLQTCTMNSRNPSQMPSNPSQTVGTEEPSNRKLKASWNNAKIRSPQECGEQPLVMKIF